MGESRGSRNTPFGTKELKTNGGTEEGTLEELPETGGEANRKNHA